MYINYTRLVNERLKHYMKHRGGEVDIPESGMEFVKRWLGERGRDPGKFIQENSL